MTLLEAAIELLAKSKTPKTAEELAAAAVEQGLVTRAGAAAVKKLDAELAAEAGDDGRIERTEEGAYLAKKGAKGKKAAAPAKKPAAAAKKPAAKKPAAKKGEAKAAKPKPAAKGKGKGKAEAAPPAQTELETFAEPPPPPIAAPIDAGRDPLEDEDEDELAERLHHTAEVLEAAEASVEAEAPVLTPEEQELSAIYGDELGAGQIAAAEFRDARSADEDRPMMPEINARAERQKMWDEKRRRRREERDARRAEREARRDGGRRPDDRGDRPERRDDRPERRDDRRPEARPALPPPPAGATAGEAAPTNGANGANGHDEHVVHRVGNTLGDAAWQVFASLRSTQPLPVKQLAAMMRKRGLLDVDPDQAWPHLKAALIGDERSYRGLGLRPRIVYRGRDLFAVGPAAQSTTSLAEAALATALSKLAVDTHNALKDRVGRATPAGFERLVHAYLVATGYEDIEWIKRVEGISYATALPPDGSSPILVSARSGDAPVDRRGVGELRAGVERKQMLAGLLLAARELSEMAERELVRPGRSIMVLCGDAFVGALIGAGVGVVTAAAPVRYVDDEFLAELLAG